MTAAAFKAAYADWKVVKTRGVVQIIFEVPLSDEGAAYKVLGGMPDPAKERWFAIAALKPEAANERMVVPTESRQTSRTPETTPRPLEPGGGVKSYAQEAGRLCADRRFQEFIRPRVFEVANMTDAQWRQQPQHHTSNFVRWFCCVETRREIVEGTPAAKQFNKLVAEYEAEKVMA